MSMSKKNFIALADTIKDFHIPSGYARTPENMVLFIIEELADFCESQNPRFNRERWLQYIAGECGPNGGSVK